MLSDYERDHGTGMDVPDIAKLLYDYTSGYPFLVSRLCRLLDDELPDAGWSTAGVEKAAGVLLMENNTLFDDMRKKIDDFPDLRSSLYALLFTGASIPYSTYNHTLEVARMFDFINVKNGKVVVQNRIFESWFYDLFFSEESLQTIIYREGSIDKNQFVKDSGLDMRHVLERFVVHYTDIYGDRDEAFHEKEGRKYFLFYLKPIINGTGHFYVEAETRDETRTDVVIDYAGRQYVVELKIWRGSSYNERGEKQLCEYLDYFHINEGYMLSFNFNKNKTPGVHDVRLGEKRIVEAVV